MSIESSLRRNSSEKSASRTSTTTKSSKGNYTSFSFKNVVQYPRLGLSVVLSSAVIESMTRPAPKPVSPFAKFRQLDKQNSTTNPRCVY